MSDYLTTPEWGETRSIYKKLSEEFKVLTNPYAVQLDARTKLMLDHLILGIDEVDLVVDQLPTKSERDDITASILKFLGDKEKVWKHPLATDSLTLKIQNINYIVQELNVQDRFHKAAYNIFDFTERKRHTVSEQELIDFVMQEGKATAELPLSIMGIAPSHAFAKFFTILCTLMGIADLIVDARSDYKAKYIAVKPSISLYLKLNAILIKYGLKLIWIFPKKISFLIYCIKFSFLLMTSKD